MSVERSDDASSNATIRDLAQSIIRAADSAGIVVRILGGVGVSMHARSSLDGPLRRMHEDIDLVIHKGARSKIDRVLAGLGSTPDRRFNALNGADRRLYYMSEGPKLDVFVGEFRMCHTIPMDDKRLTADHPTVPVAELVVTKAQIVHLTQKDVSDLIALFLDHDVSDNDNDAINGSRIAELCGGDWGLWRTMHKSLDHVIGTLPAVAIEESERATVGSRIARLLAEIDDAPKSSKWKLRSRVGDRKVWYELPEDPRRDTVVSPAEHADDPNG